MSRLTGADVAEAAEVVTRQRNLSIVLGCIAEKLAGPRAVKLLTEDTLDYLITSLEPDKPAPVILFSLIALEKFSQTSENKVTIAKRLGGYSDSNPLEILESRFLDSGDFVSRQVGFCSQWCLDNMFPVSGRKFTYTVIDNTQINMMLNSNDVSEYLKIGPNGLGARCDASSFESGKNTIFNVFFMFPISSSLHLLSQLRILVLRGVTRHLRRDADRLGNQGLKVPQSRGVRSLLSFFLTCY